MFISTPFCIKFCQMNKGIALNPVDSYNRPRNAQNVPTSYFRFNMIINGVSQRACYGEGLQKKLPAVNTMLTDFLLTAITCGRLH